MIDDAIKQLRTLEVVLWLACFAAVAGTFVARPTQARRALEQLDAIMRLFPESPTIADNAGDRTGVWNPDWLYDYISDTLESDSMLQRLRHDDEWWHVQDRSESRDLAHALHVNGLLWTAHQRTTQCRQAERSEFLFLAGADDFEAKCMRSFETPTSLREFIDGWSSLTEPLTVYVAHGPSNDAARITWYGSELPRDAIPPQPVKLMLGRGDDFSVPDVIWESAASGTTYPRRVIRGVLVHDTLLKVRMGGRDTTSVFIVNLADHVPNSHTSLLVTRAQRLERRLIDRRIAFVKVHELEWSPYASIEELFPQLTARARALTEVKFPNLREAIDSEVMRTSQRSVEVLGMTLWGVDIARFGGLAILAIHFYFLAQLVQLIGLIEASTSFSPNVAWLGLNSEGWARFTVGLADVLTPVGVVLWAAYELWNEGGWDRVWASILLGVLVSAWFVYAKLQRLSLSRENIGPHSTGLSNSSASA